MGIIGCILGFAVLTYLCYKDWSVYIAAFLSACVVILFNWTPFLDAISKTFIEGVYTSVKSFMFLLLFGCVLSRIYMESGAAYSIADTVISWLLKENSSNTTKNMIAMSIVLVIGTILSLGGIIAGVVVVLMYPITLAVFQRCDIPKRFVLGALAGGCYAFTLSVPGSPQVTNVAAMTALGTSASVGLIPGLIGTAVEIVSILIMMNIMINNARKKGEHFELHPLDPQYDSSKQKPGFIVSILPMVLLFIVFNAFQVNIIICLLGSCVLSLALFWKHLKHLDLRQTLGEAAEQSIPMTMSVGAICGFAAVITNTKAFSTMIDAILGINTSPILICAVVVTLMCMLTGGSSTGQLIALPEIAPKLVKMGLSVNVIHRVSAFASTTFDTMPYSGSILMLLPMCHMKLKDVYPPMFVTTNIATTFGTIAVAIVYALFPHLA